MAVGLLLLLVVATAIKAVGRNVFGRSLLAVGDTVELLGFLLLVSAAALATAARSHVSVHLPALATRPRLAAFGERLSDTLALLFVGCAIGGLAVLVVDAWRYGEATEAAGIPLLPVLLVAIVLLAAAGWTVVYRLITARGRAT